MTGTLESAGHLSRAPAIVQTWIAAYSGSEDDSAYGLIATADGGYALAGYTGSFGVAGDAWVLKLRPDGWYFKHKMPLMLEKAGFGATRVTGDHSDAEATDEHGVLAFIARR